MTIADKLRSVGRDVMRAILVPSILSFTPLQPLEDIVNTSHAQDLSQTKIAFMSERDIGSTSVVYDIFVMDSDGSNQTNITPEPLTGPPRSDWSPTWSPDGKKIAFTSERESPYWQIFIMNNDGSDIHNITNLPVHNTSPVWSPNGQEIAFISGKSDGYHLYIMNTDGSNRRQLSLRNVESITWSPNGSNILYSNGGNLYIIDREGKNERLFYQNGARVIDFDWSPLGNEIAIASELEGNLDIYVIDTKGNILRRLTDNPKDDRHPSWSPDGSKIVYTSTIQKHPDIPRPIEFSPFDDDIITMDADGSNKRNLTESFGDQNSDISPARQPIPKTTYVSPQGKIPTTWGYLKSKF